ncbi:Plug domain-containing protein [Hymenobacter sp. 5516J-16]|uniref:TonB-dependent receptor plug domain-containing protein n=1 Tax=Hymenobacter sp. 5516J-16 TaxID=2932253 RepID=UPI001FD1DAD8|nr:Plug domain-containing protein [Hymenobacter sp. 5516J-16]UOQ78381.1 Plug domain-containing protein [Hymenobacter sp. 5516J-16]
MPTTVPPPPTPTWAARTCRNAISGRIYLTYWTRPLGGRDFRRRGGVGYTDIRIRGTSNTGINMTINGVPLNDAESHGSFLVNLPDLASSISSIQVQRG